MEIDEQTLKNLKIHLICIALGTALGVGTYLFFLYHDISIFGWNLGLFFAPLVAGYSETIIGEKIFGKDTGAISALILFIITVIYGFIIDNSTLGLNLITIASLLVIIQAAFPTAANYFGLVVITGILSFFIHIFKKLIRYLIYKLRIFFGKPEKDIIEAIPVFNEAESNERINTKGFYYITSTDIKDKDYDNIGYFSTTAVFERNTRLIKSSPVEVEKKHLYALKTKKDECLIKLAEEIKKADGNGVIDLEINYFLNGLGGSSFQIVASGVGVKIDI